MMEEEMQTEFETVQEWCHRWLMVFHDRLAAEEPITDSTVDDVMEQVAAEMAAEWGVQP